MRSLPESFLPPLFLPALLVLLLVTVPPALCDPSSAAQRQDGQAQRLPHAAADSLPDYGGRDSVDGALQSAGAGDVSPAAQGLRALEALALVLALVVGGVYGAKRLGLVSKDGRFAVSPGAFRPKSSGMAFPGNPIAVQSSQPLPGGGGLHVVSVSGRTWLLGATAQSVTLLAELDAPAAESVPGTAQNASDTPFAALLAPDDPQNGAPTLSDTADRLQTLLSRSRSVSTTGSHR